MTESDARPTDGDGPERGGVGSLGSILHLLVVAWGAFLGLLPLNDNSFFTHLATGRLILEQGSVPTADPYTFTAAREPWTVQSWLASVGYAAAERLAGAAGVRLLVVAVFMVAASLVWRLTAGAPSLIPRLLLAAGAMVVSSGLWSERPYMVGFIGLGLVWLALEGRISHWWLVPYLWVWANVHGSFPLALVLVVAVGVGTAMDQRAARRALDLRSELLVLRSVALGAALATVSPLGWRALSFPLSAFARSDTFALIVEWQAPRFTSASERAFLLLIVAVVVGLRSDRRWRRALPVVAFIVAALLAQRNVVMAVPVLVPAIATTLPRFGSLTHRTRPAGGLVLSGLGAALVALVVVSGLAAPPLALGGYPTRPLAFLGRSDVRLVAQDFTGNLLEALDGRRADVFMDDRVDMFPSGVVEDYRVLSSGDVGWDAVLDEYDATAVAWRRSDPLGSIVAADPRWRVAFSDDRWMLAVRRGSGLAEAPADL